MELDDYRGQIDEIDSNIVKLYEKRMELSEKVARYKIREKKSVLDRPREERKLEKLRSLTSNDFNARGVSELFEQIMSMSRKKQYALMEDELTAGRLPFIAVDSIKKDGARVVFQGIEGAYSQSAMEAYFGEDVDYINVESFRDAMRAIDEGMADYAVLPIENSSAGIVTANYDLLAQFENYIVAEQIIKIDNCLMALPGTKKEDIQSVYSHPQALSQCSSFLEENPSWKVFSFANTAMAAKKVKDDANTSQAAIAGERAAKAYGLEIIERDINKSEGNSTRFIIVTNQKIFVKSAKKISVCFELPHKSGSLYRILSHFIYNDLNMTKIESRPIIDRPWEYRFFVDFEGNIAEASARSALRGLREETTQMRVLGNY